MLCENIHSHAQIQSLQARSDELARSGEHMLVNLVSLESVRMAVESYALLRPLIDWRSCVCCELDLLSVVAGLALELRKLEHDVLPQLVGQEDKRERGDLEALLLMKNSAIALSDLGKAFKEEALGRGLLVDDLVSSQVRNLSKELEDTAVLVLKGNFSIVKLRHERVPLLVNLVTTLLATRVHFSDSDEYSDEYSDE